MNIKVIIMMMLLSVSLTMGAQENSKTINTDTKGHAGGGDITTVNTPAILSPQVPTTDHWLQSEDSLHLPALNSRGQTLPLGWYPYCYCGGWNDWQLHQGLNASLDASVFAEFGKYARSGMGFGQNISLMYAIPLTKNLSLAIGGYMGNVFWQHDNYHDAGLSAVLGYKLDEHWEAYLYMQKSIINQQLPPRSVLDMNRLGDRIGATVRYNFSPNFSVEVSVEANKNERNPYHER